MQRPLSFPFEWVCFMMHVSMYMELFRLRFLSHLVYKCNLGGNSPMELMKPSEVCSSALFPRCRRPFPRNWLVCRRILTR